jgi:hypothetical protein
MPAITFIRLNQGEIGRIFAHWAIAYFGQFLENNRSRPIFWSTYFFYGKGYAFILTKIGCGQCFSKTHLVLTAHVSMYILTKVTQKRVSGMEAESV